MAEDDPDYELAWRLQREEQVGAPRARGPSLPHTQSLSLTAEISSWMPFKELRLWQCRMSSLQPAGALHLNLPSNHAPDPSGLLQLAFQRERESGRSAQSAGNGRGRDLIMQYAQVDACFIIFARLIALDSIVSSSLQVPK